MRAPPPNKGLIIPQKEAVKNPSFRKSIKERKSHRASTAERHESEFLKVPSKTSFTHTLNTPDGFDPRKKEELICIDTQKKRVSYMDDEFSSKFNTDKKDEDISVQSEYEDLGLKTSKSDNSMTGETESITRIL